MPLSLSGGNEKLALTLAQIKMVRGLFPRSDTRIYLTGPESRLSEVQTLAEPYADFVFLGAAPRSQRLLTRLYNSQEPDLLSVDGALKITVEPETQGSLLGRAVIVKAKALRLMLPRDPAVEDVSDQAQALFNEGAAAPADKPTIRRIVTGAADWTVMVLHRTLPSLRKLTNEIRVLANLKRQLSIAA
jgi:hypothetical protein